MSLTIYLLLLALDSIFENSLCFFGVFLTKIIAKILDLEIRSLVWVKSKGIVIVM